MPRASAPCNQRGFTSCSAKVKDRNALTSADFAAIWLTLQLASLTTVLLLLIGTPIAWWLAHTRLRLKAPAGALVALP